MNNPIKFDPDKIALVGKQLSKLTGVVWELRRSDAHWAELGWKGTKRCIFFRLSHGDEKMQINIQKIPYKVAVFQRYPTKQIRYETCFYPYTESNYRIGVGYNRHAATIAQEVNRRLLPHAIPLWEQGEKQVAINKQQREAYEDAIQQYLDYVSPDEQDRFLIEGDANLKTQHCKIRVSTAGPKYAVTLELGYLEPELAKAVLGMVEGYRQYQENKEKERLETINKKRRRRASAVKKA